MEQTKDTDSVEIQDNVSIIRDTVKTIIKNVRYGTYENLLRDLLRIESAAFKIQSCLQGHD